MDIEKVKLHLQVQMDKVDKVDKETRAAKTEEMLHFLDGKHVAYRALLRWLNETPEQ